MDARGENKVDLSNWALDVFEPIRSLLEPLVMKAASEALQMALEDDETYVFYSSKEAVTANPDILCVRFALANNDRESPTFKFSLQECLDEYLLGQSTGAGPIATDSIESVAQLRDMFLSMAAQCDAMLAKS
jgi:hypothetical protein